MACRNGGNAVYSIMKLKKHKRGTVTAKQEM